MKKSICLNIEINIAYICFIHVMYVFVSNIEHTVNKFKSAVKQHENLDI